MAIILSFLSGCSSLEPPARSSQNSTGNYRQQLFMLAEQQAPPQEIQSLQLYPKGKPAQPPIITLGKENQLTLAFDYLSEQSRQFRIKISHRGQSWEESNISPTVYLDSFNQTYIQKSVQSTADDPTYQHVEYHFPNDNLRPTVSGNYLLEVYSYRGDQLLFSMPFFISEEKGELQTKAAPLLAQRPDGRSVFQLFTTYHYPPTVEFPQFDLSVSYAQNQFWGRMRPADFLNTSTPGQLAAELNREHAFVADYPFQLLNLRTFRADGRQILEFQPGTTPPTVTLRRDVQHLSIKPQLLANPNIGFALNDRNSRYAEVQFSLEANKSIPPSAELYIVGDFNNWMISELNKMQFNADNQRWEGQALIKQGEYRYTYARVEQRTITDLNLGQSFFTGRQEYLTFVYFKDPNQLFDRLLKVQRTLQR